MRQALPSRAFPAADLVGCGTAQLLAAEVREAGHDGLLINAYCPGRITTDMLRQSTDNARTPDEGAAQGVALALLPPLSTVS